MGLFIPVSSPGEFEPVGADLVPEEKNESLEARVALLEQTLDGAGSAPGEYKKWIDRYAGSVPHPESPYALTVRERFENLERQLKYFEDRAVFKQYEWPKKPWYKRLYWWLQDVWCGWFVRRPKYKLTKCAGCNGHGSENFGVFGNNVCIDCSGSGNVYIQD